MERPVFFLFFGRCATFFYFLRYNLCIIILSMFFHKKNIQWAEHGYALLSGFIGGILGSLLTLIVSFVLFHTMNMNWVFTNSAQKPLSIMPFFIEPKQKNETPLPKDSSSQLLDVSEIVEKVNPAVVSIVISKDVPNVERYFVNPFGENSPFQQFQIPRYRQNGTKNKEVGGGSGFLISSDGYVVSNAHVVRDPNATYTVFLNGGKKHEAKVIALDDVLDVALLKIEATNLPFVEFGNSDQLKLGQSVVAIGNALGEFRNTVSTGVVSGLSRSITAKDGYTVESLDNLIQTDAAINPGNSGGPLINREGKVIGVNVAVAQGSENVGFALPINLIIPSIESMKVNGKVQRPFLGVRYIPITPELQKDNQLSVDYGVLILRGEQQTDLAVIPGSPANKAGIVEYDILLEINGKKIDLEHPLSKLIRQMKIGEQIKIKLLHQGVEKEITVMLEEAK